MKAISGLSLALCAVSMVMSIVYGLIPGSNPTKSLIKSLSEFICAAIIITCVFSVLKGGEQNLFEYSDQYDSTKIEAYVAESNSISLLNSAKTLTSSVFEQYGVKCTKILIQESNGEGYLQYNIDSSVADIDALENALYEKTNIKSKVIVD